MGGSGTRGAVGTGRGAITRGLRLRTELRRQLRGQTGRQAAATRRRISTVQSAIDAARAARG